MTNSLGHLLEKERINLEPMSKRDKLKAKLLDGNRVPDWRAELAPPHRPWETAQPTLNC
jgi:hypothetical protein